MSRVKRHFTELLILVSLLFTPLLASAPVVAHHCFGHVGTSNVDIAECADAGACLDTGAPTCQSDVPAEARINNTIRLVVNLLSLLVGVVAVIMVIVGGLKYVTSGGDSNNVASAKNTILYAIIGLVVVALAQVIVRFVLQKATQTTNASMYLPYFT